LRKAEDKGNGEWLLQVSVEKKRRNTDLVEMAFNCMQKLEFIE